MADNTMSLFGSALSPDEMQQQLTEQRALQFANLGQNQRLAMLGYKAGAGIGQGLGGLFGVDTTDPAVRQASQVRQLATQFNTNTPEGLAKYAQALQAINPQLAAQAAMMATDMAQKQASLSKTTFESRKLEAAAAQEEQLRKELSDLGTDATEEDIMKVVTKYGSPDKVLATLQAATSKREATQQRMDDAKARLENQLQIARENNASKQEIARIQIEGRKELASIAQALKGPKALPASLQKAEDEDLTKIDAATAQAEALNPVINALTPDPTTGKRKLDLSPTKIAGYMYQNATGRSSEESRAYAQLKEAVGAAVNIKTSAEKGVQTDKDVLRFADALIAASGRGDSQATLEALKRFNEANLKDQERIQKRVNSRRTSQGVEAYYPELGTGKQPAKAPEASPATTPKATKRFNPATGQIEAI